MIVLEREKITGLSAVKTLTVPAGSQFLHIQAMTNNVRFTRDGSTTPSATVGQVITAGDPPMEFSAQEMRFTDVQLIEETASAQVEVEFMGSGY